jgi:hypothetical protein
MANVFAHIKKEKTKIFPKNITFFKGFLNLFNLYGKCVVLNTFRSKTTSFCFNQMITISE